MSISTCGRPTSRGMTKPSHPVGGCEGFVGRDHIFGISTESMR